LINDQQLIM